MKRTVFAVACAVVVLVGGCATAAAPKPSSGHGGSVSTTEGSGSTITISGDALGRSVSFTSVPRRIVIAGKALFMVADAVYMFPEASSRVVALGSTVQNKLGFIPVIDPAYSSKTILDGSAGPEQIAATHPDVVLMKSSNADTLGKPLEAVGIKVVYVDFETPDQYSRDLGTLGQLFDDQARANQLIAFFQTRTDRVTAALAGLQAAQKPKVLLLYYSNKNGTVAFNVPPLGYIQSTEAELAGGQLVWRGAQLGGGWTTVTLEQIAAWNPDQIFVVAYSGSVDDVVARLKADPQWKALRAVEQDSLYAFPGDYYSWDQPDPRWVLGLTWLADKVHPDRFADLDMTSEIESFYQDLYGMDKASFETNVKPSLSGDLP